MLTDSHCHLASQRFGADEVPTLIRGAAEAGVSRLVTLATCLDDLPLNLAIAQDPAVHACIGIHPCDVHEAPDDAVEILASHVADPRVCGIGETGLDYYHSAPEGWEEDDFRGRQRDFLDRHFQLAAAAGLPVVIHTRDRSGDASFRDALEIFRRHHHAVRAVFHCFAGTWESAHEVLELGGLVSFGGVATFKNAGLVRETAARCPAGSFMIETDAPYLAPHPHRGQRNEPGYVSHTAAHLAELRGETLVQFAAHTTAAAVDFFRFRPNP
jgi:TatD DNase family protein